MVSLSARPPGWGGSIRTTVWCPFRAVTSGKTSNNCSQLTGLLLRLERCWWRPGGVNELRGPASPGDFARAGLRWCGGWRRMNLGGSHDQTQIYGQGRHALGFTKVQQVKIPQATYTSIIEVSSAGRHQACPHHCNAANASGRNDPCDHDCN